MNRLSSDTWRGKCGITENNTEQGVNHAHNTPTGNYSGDGIACHFIHQSRSGVQYIRRAASYAESEQAYPVLYVLKGNFLFGLVTDTVRLLDFSKEVQGIDELQEIIIVGVGYPDLDTFQFRSGMGVIHRDYAPTNIGMYEKYWSPKPDAPKFVGEGEAAQFLEFLSEELLPYINSNYRTLPDENAILGFSLSGSFGLYALFKQPGTFKRYFVGSPSLWWDDHTIFELEQEFASNHDDLDAWLFMSVGEGEPDFMISDMYRMAQTLKDRDYQNLEIVTHFFHGESHMSVVPASICRGLKAAFVNTEK